MSNNNLPISSDNNNALVPLSAAGEWQTIVDNIIDNLADDELPEDVLKATEYLICGWPTAKVAKRIGRKKETIRGWLTKYPQIAVAVNYGQRELQKWRLAQLEQQFLSAVETSQQILDLGNENREIEEEVVPINPKVLAIKAQQARFIISLFAGQKMDIKVKSPSDETPLLKAKTNALDYLAKRIATELDDTITAKPEVTYRVIDSKTDATGPMLDENGNPYYGELGKFDENEDGIICHICGERQKKLYPHVTRHHKMSAREYEMIFMLDKGSLVEHGR